MTFKELEQHAIFPNGSRILPLFEEIEIVLEDGSIEYDYIIIKSSEEIYNEWLADKDKPVEPNKMEVLKARVDGLENINAGLLLENAEHQINIQEQEKMNKEQEVTNANLLLEIAMLKGAML